MMAPGQQSVRHGAGRSGVVLAVAVVTLIVLLAAPTAAHAAVVTTAAPSPGGTVTAAPVVISATFDDAATMTTSATMTLDGVKVGASFDYPVGYWWHDPEGCEPSVWIVTDPTVGRMTYTAATIADGSHNATVTMRNALGETTEYAWSFRVAVTPRVVSVSPAPGAVVVNSTDPTMVINVADNGTSVSGTLTLDGTAVSTTWDSANMRFLHKPSPPFSPISSHTATMTLSDADGHTSSYRWTFQILTVADVTFSGRTPASGTVLTDWGVPVSIRADDAQFALQAQAPSGVSIDGVSVPTGYWYPVGWWDDGDGCYEPVWRVTDYTILDLSASAATITDGPHVVSALAHNSQGVSAQTTWPITVAAPPRAYGFTPASGTTTTTPLIRATVADNGPGSPNVTMSVDGTVVASTYDPGTQLVSYTPAVPLSDDSTHTVWLQMRDASGYTSTAGWSFSVQTTSRMSFSQETPAPGSTYTTTAVVPISVLVTDTVDLVPSSAQVSIDGAALAVTTDIQTPRRVTVRAAPPGLADGSHTASVTVNDVIDLPRSQSWSFQVQKRPVTSTPLPASGSTTEVARPTIGLNVSDNTPGSVEVSVSVDGRHGITQQTAQGAWRWRLTWDLKDDMMHTAVVQVRDAAGNMTSATWSFRVLLYPSMADSTPCTTCHVGYPYSGHVAITPDCGSCHDEHGSGGPVPCNGCHEGSHDISYVAAYPCTQCHQPYWAGRIIQHAPMDVSHDATLALDCSTCHTSILTREHARWPASGTKYDCTTCHLSASNAVTSAIAAGNSACPACHGTVDHADLHNAPFGSSCETCHSGNLVTEHVTTHAYTCRTCHESTTSTVVAAIAAGNLDCAGCHAAANHAHPVDGLTGVQANGERLCLDCHDADLFTEHAKTTSSSRAAGCSACHLTGGPRDSVPAWGGTCSEGDCHVSGTSHAVHSTYCAGCHDASRDTTFAVNKVDFVEPKVDPAACRTCHWISMNDGVFSSFTHGHADGVAPRNGPNCGKCHPAWMGGWSADLTKLPVEGTEHGFFSDSASPSSTAPTIHQLHVNGSWPKDLNPGPDYPNSCRSCHGPAGCDTCHVTPDPATHVEHTRNESTLEYPAGQGPVTYNIGAGTIPGRGDQVNFPETASTCVNANCHALTKAGDVTTFEPACSSCHPDRVVDHGN